VPPRLLAGGASIDPLRCCRSQVSRESQLGFSGVQLPFSLVQRMFPRVGRHVSHVGSHVTLASQLVASVTNEVALLSRPLTFHVR
jgi:hypothetical protein